MKTLVAWAVMVVGMAVGLGCQAQNTVTPARAEIKNVRAVTQPSKTIGPCYRITVTAPKENDYDE